MNTETTLEAAPETTLEAAPDGEPNLYDVVPYESFPFDFTVPERLHAAQTLFAATGALHAAGLFTPEGELMCLREDVGRHNAVDKIIGWAALHERLPLTGHVLLVSGRTGFEIVQKATMAQLPVVAGISGSSSLAIELAQASGMTLVSFLRGADMNLCSRPERITGA